MRFEIYGSGERDEEGVEVGQEVGEQGVGSGGADDGGPGGTLVHVAYPVEQGEAEDCRSDAVERPGRRGADFGDAERGEEPSGDEHRDGEGCGQEHFSRAVRQRWSPRKMAEVTTPAIVMQAHDPLLKGQK